MTQREGQSLERIYFRRSPEIYQSRYTYLRYTAHPLIFSSPLLSYFLRADVSILG